jgi:hypothetical protein
MQQKLLMGVKVAWTVDDVSINPLNEGANYMCTLV